MEDDERPTTRHVRIGYALTAEGQMDLARIGKVEELPAAEAKVLVRGGRAQYASGPDPVAGSSTDVPPVSDAVERPAGVWGGPKRTTPAAKSSTEE